MTWQTATDIAGRWRGVTSQKVWHFGRQLGLDSNREYCRPAEVGYEYSPEAAALIERELLSRGYKRARPQPVEMQQVLEGAERAREQMKSWPKWKRDLSLSIVRGFGPDPDANTLIKPHHFNDDGSGYREGSLDLPVSELLALQVQVGAPVTIEAHDSDPACENWGSVEISWPAPAPVDPLHERARKALASLELDGSALETAVSVFGWDSDAVRGVLLGLVRKAWGAARVAVSIHEDAVVVSIYRASGTDCRGFVVEEEVFEVDAGTLGEALVCALEAAPRRSTTPVPQAEVSK